MTARTPRLPGMAPGPRRRGRNERAIDAVAKYLRGVDLYDDHRAAVLTTARTLAASLDRLEADTDRSEHVVATVARVQLQALVMLRPDGAGDPQGDSLDRLVDAMGAALRDSAQA